MSSRKIQVVPPNNLGQQHSYYKNKPDTWTKLRGQDEFRNLTSTKVRELAGVGASEMLGTAIFVGLGCCSTITGIDGSENHASHLNTVLTFAFAICLSLTVFAHTSGCHINPAISLSAVIFGRLSLPRFLLYVVSQCAGGCLGIIVVKVRGADFDILMALFKDIVSPEGCTEGSFCVTLPNPQVGTTRAMLVEAILTGILIWVCNAVWDRRCQDKHDSLPAKFAMAAAALALPGAKYSGSSMNPARSFGPAFISGNWTHHWVYWVGPLSGSAVASLFYLALLAESNPPIAVPTQPQDAEEELHCRPLATSA